MTETERQTEGKRDRDRERKKGRKNIINYSFLRIGVRKERLLIDHCTFSCLIKNFPIRSKSSFSKKPFRKPNNYFLEEFRSKY
jgi:hypothetical protein